MEGWYLPWPGGGVPTFARGYLLWGGDNYLGRWGVSTLAGVPPPRCGQTHACENSTFLHPSDVGGKKLRWPDVPVLYRDLGGCSCWSCCAYVNVFLGLRGTALTTGAALCAGLHTVPPKPKNDNKNKL